MSVGEKILQELSEVEEKSVEEYAKYLITKGDVEYKTEIHKPITLSILDMLVSYLTEKNLNNTATIIKRFLYWFRVNMISYQRKSRREYVNALIGLRETSDEKEVEEKIRKLFIKK
ncbi:MAG: hypothetical protein QXK24_08375 [Ignisphaera sp.]